MCLTLCIFTFGIDTDLLAALISDNDYLLAHLLIAFDVLTLVIMC